MKQIYLIIVLTFIVNLLWSEQQFTLPFSISAVKSDQNLVDNLYSVDPDDSTLCPVLNKVWFWYDRRKIYFLWEMADQAGFSSGRFTPEDKWPDADYVRIQLITDVKSYHSYSFYAFPLGNRYDGIRKPDHSFDKNWDSSYQYETILSPQLWSVLMEIPFKDLRFHGIAPYNWKLILTRYIKSTDRTYSSPFVITRMGKDYFRRASGIILDQEISRSLNLFFRPYLIFNYDLEADKQEFDTGNLGIDISANPGYSTRIKTSINPDFSDVPLDDELDIYNSRYAPVLEENRYFFIEDLNVFGIDNNIFYSRHINQPQYALKFTSNSHHFSFGLLSTRDRASNFSQDDFYNIISFKPSSQKSSLQITLLNRMNTDLKKYHNEVLYLAPQMEIGRYTYLWSEINLSYKELDSQQTRGYYGKIGLSKYLKDFYLTLSAQQMSRDYAMDMGRIYEDDFYGWNISVIHDRYLGHSWIRKLGSELQLSEEIDNSSDQLLERLICGNYWLEFRGRLKLTTDFQYVKEYYAGRMFEKNRLGLRFIWEKLNWFQPKFACNHMQTLVYSFLRTYRVYYLQYGLSGNLSRYLAYSIAADNIIYLHLPASPEIDDNYWLANIDLTCSLTNRISLTGGLRFNNYEWFEYSDHWGVFANFQWEFSPASYLYVGYKSTFDKFENNFTRDYEKIYLKLSYSI